MAVTIFRALNRWDPPEMRRYSKPLTETRRHRYHVVRTTRQEETRWAAEDRARAIAHLQHLAAMGPLTPAQHAQLLALLPPDRSP